MEEIPNLRIKITNKLQLTKFQISNREHRTQNAEYRTENERQN